MSSNKSHLDRKRDLSKKLQPELIDIIVGVERDLNQTRHELYLANKKISHINEQNKKFNARIKEEKQELRVSNLKFIDQFKVLCTDMNISSTDTPTIRYNKMRSKLQELSNNQSSSNLSVASNSNSGCSSYRTCEDLHSGCNGDNNIMYMLSDLVNTLIDQKKDLDMDNSMLDKDNKRCNMRCRVLSDKNKELVDKDKFQSGLQTRIVELTNQGTEWKNKHDSLKDDYNRVLEENITTMNDEKLATSLKDDAKLSLKEARKTILKLTYYNGKQKERLLNNAGIVSSLESLKSRSFSETSSNISDDHPFASPSHQVRSQHNYTPEQNQKMLDDKIRVAVTQLVKQQSANKQYVHNQLVASRNSELCHLFFKTDQLFDGHYYRPVDVPGDGNCLFHALIASGLFPQHDHTSLRLAVCNCALMNNEGIIKKVLKAFKNIDSKVEFNQYFNRMKINAAFAGTTEMFVIYILFNINVISYTNQLYEFKPQLYPKLDVKELLESNLKKDGPFHTMKNVKTIHNFHHVYKIPH